VPIYEYACKSCDHTLDALQKMSDDPLVDCPVCGMASLKRLISAPRFRLKGEGWYETDFKRDNQRNLSTGDADQGKEKSDDGKVKSDDGKVKSGDSKVTDGKSAGSTSDKSAESKPKVDTGSTTKISKKSSTESDSS